MILGTVTSYREAVIQLTVRGPLGKAVLTAVVDTGFAGTLAIPKSVMVKLGLKYIGPREAQLANDLVVEMEEFAGEVAWDGQYRMVSMLATVDTVLVGMEMMDGFDLNIHVTDGGPVVLAPLGE